MKPNRAQNRNSLIRDPANQTVEVNCARHSKLSTVNVITEEELQKLVVRYLTDDYQQSHIIHAVTGFLSRHFQLCE